MQCFDNKNFTVTPACDIFSFGVLMCEMLTRQPPWEGLAPLQVAVSVVVYRKRVQPPQGDALCPLPLRKLIDACMSPDPKARPSAAEVAKKLVLLSRRLSIRKPTNTSESAFWGSQAPPDAEELLAPSGSGSG